MTEQPKLMTHRRLAEKLKGPMRHAFYDVVMEAVETLRANAGLPEMNRFEIRQELWDKTKALHKKREAERS